MLESVSSIYFMNMMGKLYGRSMCQKPLPQPITFPMRSGTGMGTLHFFGWVSNLATSSGAARVLGLGSGLSSGTGNSAEDGVFALEGADKQLARLLDQSLELQLGC
jgi:hypothetical protein